MKVEQLLKSNLVNLSEIAKQIYPTAKNPISKLNNKVNNNDGRRLTDKDKQAIQELFKQYL